MSLKNELEQRWTWTVTGVIVLLTIWTFTQRYLVDDAFISFRYAGHLAQGLGLVWNPGERIEGFTNFLWTLLCAGGIKLGFSPERFSVLLSLPCFVLALILCYTLALKITTERWLALAAVVLVGMTRSVYCFTTSGLETPLQLAEFLALTTFLVNCSEDGWNVKRALAISLLLAVMLLTRPDAVVPGAVALWFLWKSRDRANAKIWIAFILPGLFIALCYAAWKISYFGALLPNSFHTKVRDLSEFAFGLLYLHLFFLSHLLYPFIFLALWQIKSLMVKLKGLNELIILTGAWLLYTASVGGDFMDFRFLVPVVPFILIIILASIKEIAAPPMRMALMAALLFGILHGSFALEKLVFGYGIESAAHLHGHLTREGDDWVRIGKKLGDAFKGSDVIISAGAAGVIPYYSELTTVDFMGLNDKVIPNVNEPFSRVPGHRIISTVDYLAKRGVNLIIEPNNNYMTRQEFVNWARNPSWRDLYRYYLDPDRPVLGKSLDSTTLLGIPVDDGGVLVAWYLTPNPTVDKIAADNKWPKFNITRW